MPPTKHKQQVKSAGTGFSVAGSILIALGAICLIYAYNALKIFFQFQDNMETAGDNAEGLDALGAMFGAIFAFGSVGIESLALAIGIGVVGLILVIIGVSLFSLGFNKYYSR